jgi:hypothetical protein
LHLLDRYVLDPHAPWVGAVVRDYGVPGMISDEERRYYEWIGIAYAGLGEVVELGPWLGRSTLHIVRGLMASAAFSRRRLHVVDDFVWRSSWMDSYYERPDRPGDGESFQPIFERYVAPIADLLEVRRARIADHGDNSFLPPLAWSGEPIEIAYIDCGRTFEVNEAWYQALGPSFIPDRTLVIMQDWQLYKEQPPQPYNQTKEFTDSKGPALELLHEIVGGAIGTFLYRGP